jgi:hypothetical protein
MLLNSPEKIEKMSTPYLPCYWVIVNSTLVEEFPKELEDSLMHDFRPTRYQPVRPTDERENSDKGGKTRKGVAESE